MIEQQQATTIPLVFQETSFQITFDPVKKFIKKDLPRYQVGGVAQDGCTLFFWVEGDPDPLIVYAYLLQELSRCFSWILERQIRIIDNAIDIFWSKDVAVRVRLVNKHEFDQRVAGVQRDLIEVDL